MQQPTRANDPQQPTGPQPRPPRMPSVPIWVLLALVGVWTLVCGGIWGYVSLTRPTAGALPTASAVFVVVTSEGAGDLTADPTLVLLGSATPDVTPTVPVGAGGITLGARVQVTGTGSDGLRLRQGAGLDFQSNYLGIEYELFDVQDGPVNADGFVWWFLVAPDDNTRNGWAVDNYLAPVQGAP